MTYKTIISIYSDLNRIKRFSERFTSVEGPQYWTPGQRNALHVTCRAQMISEAIATVLNRRARNTEATKKENL